MKKKKFEYEKFESAGEFVDGNGKKRKDTSVRICESMLFSDAFSALTNRQKMLYICCKSQFFGKRKPCQDIEILYDDCFYMSFSTIIPYKIYTKNMKSEYYKDLKILVDLGFIELIAKGNSRKKSIYKYSDRWKKYKVV